MEKKGQAQVTSLFSGLSMLPQVIAYSVVIVVCLAELPCASARSPGLDFLSIQSSFSVAALSLTAYEQEVCSVVSERQKGNEEAVQEITKFADRFEARQRDQLTTCAHMARATDDPNVKEAWDSLAALHRAILAFRERCRTVREGPFPEEKWLKDLLTPGRTNDDEFFSQLLAGSPRAQKVGGIAEAKAAIAEPWKRLQNATNLLPRPEEH